MAKMEVVFDLHHPQASLGRDGPLIFLVDGSTEKGLLLSIAGQDAETNCQRICQREVHQRTACFAANVVVVIGFAPDDTTKSNKAVVAVGASVGLHRVNRVTDRGRHLESARNFDALVRNPSAGKDSNCAVCQLVSDVGIKPCLDN